MKDKRPREEEEAPAPAPVKRSKKNSTVEDSEMHTVNAEKPMENNHNTDAAPTDEGTVKAKKKKIRHRKKPEGTEDAQPSSESASQAEFKQHQKGGKKLSKVDEKKAMNSERRRLRRTSAADRKKTCFRCRRRGHSVANCPKVGDSSEASICYRCGSDAHALAACPKPLDKANPYPFATCFVCKEVGHVSGSCPKNAKGLYIKGGGCKICGSVRHRANDCDVKKKTVDEPEAVVGVIRQGMGGDDLDDAYVFQPPSAAAEKAAADKPKKRKVNFYHQR
ncbi:hypothetical protein SmJEL517_g02113 [Synchytrium microbalum]|uniref:CCHC-type domain-containing protein n=1 Tax=Synchytrium microbalum TaxID=1806994 RepID=A0A507CD91_9FUNG|nr:uncharacterized protein SmJEL517_g02113 [Synchytrium microbalum]TPX35503.1 hypothetical protein SmJEL517_g02113 [Synchytrium microbalum]